jgi:hypothetical protein
MAESKVKADALIRDDHITVSEPCASAGTEKPAVLATIIKLGCISLHKAGAKNSHRQTPKHPKKTSVHRCLQRSYKDRDVYLSRITTSDETWVHHYDPPTNRQSVEWHHHSALFKRKVKV